MCVYWVGGAGSRVTVSGCTGKGRDQRQRPLLQSGLQDLQPMRQVTLELQLVYLQNERLDFCVESPSSNTTLAIYQNNKTLRKILHFLLCSFPSSVRWWWEQNISTAVLLQRHSVDNHTWHMVGTLNRREKEKVWLSKVPPSKKKKKDSQSFYFRNDYSAKNLWNPTGVSLGHNMKISLWSIFQNNWFEYIRILSRYKSSEIVNVLLRR